MNFQCLWHNHRIIHSVYKYIRQIYCTTLIKKKKKRVATSSRSGTAVNIIYYKAKTTINLILKQTNYLTDGIVFVFSYTAVCCYCVVQCDDVGNPMGLIYYILCTKMISMVILLCRSNLSMFLLAGKYVELSCMMSVGWYRKLYTKLN